jgi:hypothetical protein
MVEIDMKRLWHAFSVLSGFVLFLPAMFLMALAFTVWPEDERKKNVIRILEAFKETVESRTET